MALIQLAASYLFALEQETNFSPIYTAYLRNKLITVIKSHSHSVQHTSVTPGSDKHTQLASWTVPSKWPNPKLLFSWLSPLDDEAKTLLQIPPPCQLFTLSVNRSLLQNALPKLPHAHQDTRRAGKRSREQSAHVSVPAAKDRASWLVQQVWGGWDGDGPAAPRPRHATRWS